MSTVYLTQTNEYQRSLGGDEIKIEDAIVTQGPYGISVYAEGYEKGSVFYPYWRVLSVHYPDPQARQ